MNGKINKLKAIGMKPADAAADIGLINQHSLRELAPDEVYCFSVVLCDNDIDRDMERFTDASLDAFVPLFCGVTGLSDHRWSAERQMARLYHVEAETTEEENFLGEPLRRLLGKAYMLKNESFQPTIDAIEAGIMKEVSIGFAIGKTTCSICGEALKGWRGECANGHRKGTEYEEGLCYGNLEDPQDAYEFSFVAVPAQPKAGATKGMKGLDEAFGELMAADLSGHCEEAKELIPRLQAALLGEEEREKRARMLAENERYLKRYA